MCSFYRWLPPPTKSFTACLRCVSENKLIVSLTTKKYKMKRSLLKTITIKRIFFKIKKRNSIFLFFVSSTYFSVICSFWLWNIYKSRCIWHLIIWNVVDLFFFIFSIYLFINWSAGKIRFWWRTFSLQIKFSKVID